MNEFFTVLFLGGGVSQSLLRLSSNVPLKSPCVPRAIAMPRAACHQPCKKSSALCILQQVPEDPALLLQISLELRSHRRARLW